MADTITKKSTIGGIPYDDLCRGLRKYYCFNLVDLLDTSPNPKPLPFGISVQTLVKQVEDTFADILMQQNDKEIESFTIGKTHARRVSTKRGPYGRSFHPFERKDPRTWKFDNGINGRWRDYCKNQNYDGLVALTAVTNDVIPNDVKSAHHEFIDVEQYSIALEQSLIRHYMLERPDYRLANESFNPGCICKGSKPYAGVVYVAFKLGDLDEQVDDQTGNSPQLSPTDSVAVVLRQSSITSPQISPTDSVAVGPRKSSITKELSHNVTEKVAVESMVHDEQHRQRTSKVKRKRVLFDIVDEKERGKSAKHRKSKRNDQQREQVLCVSKDGLGSRHRKKHKRKHVICESDIIGPQTSVIVKKRSVRNNSQSTTVASKSGTWQSTEKYVNYISKSKTRPSTDITLEISYDKTLENSQEIRETGRKCSSGPRVSTRTLERNKREGSAKESTSSTKSRSVSCPVTTEETVLEQVENVSEYSLKQTTSQEIRRKKSKLKQGNTRSIHDCNNITSTPTTGKAKLAEVYDTPGMYGEALCSGNTYSTLGERKNDTPEKTYIDAEVRKLLNLHPLKEVVIMLKKTPYTNDQILTSNNLSKPSHDISHPNHVHVVKRQCEQKIPRESNTNSNEVEVIYISSDEEDAHHTLSKISPESEQKNSSELIQETETSVSISRSTTSNKQPNIKEEEKAESGLSQSLQDLTADKRNHEQNNQQRQTFQCSFCGRLFLERDHLERHENVHTWDILYVCKYCEKTFTTDDRCKRHEEKHETKDQCGTSDIVDTLDKSIEHDRGSTGSTGSTRSPRVLCTEHETDNISVRKPLELSAFQNGEHEIHSATKPPNLSATEKRHKRNSDKCDKYCTKSVEPNDKSYTDLPLHNACNFSSGETPKKQLTIKHFFAVRNNVNETDEKRYPIQQSETSERASVEEESNTVSHSPVNSADSEGTDVQNEMVFGAGQDHVLHSNQSSQPKSLKKKRNDKFNENPNVCSYCGKRFTDSPRRIRHENFHHISF